MDAGHLTDCVEEERSLRTTNSGVSGFARQVLRVLDRTEYRLCDSGEDLEAIYRIRYKSYLLNGIIEPNSEQMYYDDLDELDNCWRFGVFIDGEMVSTVRIHAIDSIRRQSPSTVAFGDILGPRLDAGETFVDPSRFATDPDHSSINPLIPYITLRVAGAACIHFNVSYCLSTVRTDHAGFYRKIYRATQIAEPRSYPDSKVPVVAYQANVNAIKEESFRRYPFFKSSALERSLLFDRPSLGSRAPLTVLPSVRRFDRAA